MVATALQSELIESWCWKGFRRFDDFL